MEWAVIIALIDLTAMAVIEAASFLRDYYPPLSEETPPTWETPPAEIQDENLLNESDLQLIEESKRILQDHLGDDVPGDLMSLIPEDRIKAIEGIAHDLVNLYHVEIKGIEFTILSNTIAGEYDHENQLITINSTWLFANDRFCMLDMINTLFHEMRHAIQWSIVEYGGAEWGVDEVRRKALAYSFYHYIPAEIDFAASQKQLVERDAVTFANKVMEEVATA